MALSGRSWELRGTANLQKEPCFEWRGDEREVKQRLPRAGRSEEGGTGDELGGRSESRAEKRLERAQEETGGRGGCDEKEGAGRRDEGRVVAVPL